MSSRPDRTATTRVLPEHVYEPIAGISIQLLWFLGAYVLVLAAVPLLSHITTRGRLVGALLSAYAFVAVVDILRINFEVPKLVSYLTMAAWLIPGMLGVAYRRRLLDGRTACGVGVAMLGVNLALLWFGPYELSLVGIDSQQLKNMTPPSLLLAGHAIMMCAFAIAAAPAINLWAQRPRVWWLAAIGNSGAMTLYLWHMPLLLAVHLVFDYLGMARFDWAAPDFVVLTMVQLAIMAALVGLTFATLRPLENNPLPLWDGGFVARPGARSAAVGALLSLAGAATLASVGWGLKEQGLWCVAVMLVALVGARALATPPGSAPLQADRSPSRSQQPESTVTMSGPPSARSEGVGG